MTKEASGRHSTDRKAITLSYYHNSSDILIQNNMMKSQIGLFMGAIIVTADLYWSYASYPDRLWLTLGAIIFVEDLVWIAMDFALMRESGRTSQAEKQVSTYERSSISK